MQETQTKVIELLCGGNRLPRSLSGLGALEDVSPPPQRGLQALSDISRTPPGRDLGRPQSLLSPEARSTGAIGAEAPSTGAIVLAAGSGAELSATQGPRRHPQTPEKKTASRAELPLRGGPSTAEKKRRMDHIYAFSTSGRPKKQREGVEAVISDSTQEGEGKEEGEGTQEGTQEVERQAHKKADKAKANKKADMADKKSDRGEVGGEVGAMLQERDAEREAEKKAREAEKKAEREAEKKAKGKGKNAKKAGANVEKGKGKKTEGAEAKVAKGKGKKTEGAEGSVKGKGAEQGLGEGKVRKPCVHFEGTRSQYLGRSGRDGKGSSRKFRFAGANANYADQASAKQASDAWLEEELKHWSA